VYGLYVGVCLCLFVRGVRRGDAATQQNSVVPLLCKVCKGYGIQHTLYVMLLSFTTEGGACWIRVVQLQARASKHLS
jgi:hypothetical protein